ncbi:MAG: HAMP domain-containing protein, partial [Actinobacteria bacterium]|nr:HAMP domain-containing protein [Actinomycetota bacterium]
MIPLHLAVHVLGLTVTLGLAGYAVLRRRDASVGWVGLFVGGLLLAVSHVATGSLLAGDAGWPIYLRAAGYAALAVGAAGRLVGTMALVAVAPPAVHIAAAIAGGAAALAAARGVLGRGRSVLPLAGGLACWAAADLLVRTDTRLAGGLSVAGSLLAGAWLLRRARSSLFARFVGSFLAVLLILVIGLASASGVVFSTDLQRDQLRRLDELTAGRAEQLNEAIPLELARSAEPLSGATLASELAAAPGEHDLDARARSITVFPGIDTVALVDARGDVVGSWDSLATPPARLSDAAEFLVAGDEIVDRALAGSTASGLVSLGDGGLLAVGAAPVAPRTEGGRPQLDRLAGAILLVREITDQRIVAELQRRAGADTTILVGAEPVASTLEPERAVQLADAVRTNGRSHLAELDDTEVFVSAAPLVGADGTRAGTLVLTLDGSAIADIEETFTRSLFAVAIAGMALAAALAAAAASRTTRPIRRLTAAAARVAEGDLDVRVAIDRDDEVGRLAASFDDMTAVLSEREAALLAAAGTEADLRQRIETITSSMGEALLAVDRDGRVTAANPAAASLLGRDLVDLAGRPLRELLRGEAGGRSLLAALGSPTSERPAAARGTLGTGRRGLPVSATAAPLTGPSGETDGRVYVLRDISGEVEVERMKTEFLSNISHELRTPLTPIKGYAEVMRAKDIGRDRTVEFAANIAMSAQRLERIIGMLVDFAALEAGRMEVVLEPTDLGGVVDDVLTRWRERFPERTFRRRLARGLPPVQVDPDLLARVFEELIDNAVKFSEDDVRILASAGEDGTVHVTVRDRGQGMEEEELDVILRDFHQVDGSATRRFGGLGLGLSIVQRILERFDADIR